MTKNANNTWNYLRIKQISRNLEQFMKARGTSRPNNGWILAMRELSGRTLRESAANMKIRHQSFAALEKSEAEETITLKKLRQAAEALDCELVYALVPRKGTIQEYAEAKTLQKVRSSLMAIEHSMTLENQQTGNIEEKIREQVKKIKYGK